VSDAPLSEEQIRDTLAAYLGLLQRHVSAEEMMSKILTDDFETGFVGGHLWKGLDGLRDFLSQREGFFDERHEVKDVLALTARSDDELEVKTRLELFLRRWEPPSPTSDQFTGWAFHTWILRRSAGQPEWRVAAQLVDGFDHLNDNATRLFSTPEEGLKR
jgi:hypothetical protein